MKLINKIKLALFKHRNKKLEQLDYIDWNFIKNTINNDKKVKIQEPQTIAEIRLKGGAKDKGYQEGIRLYNSHKIIMQNQWVNPLTSLNTGWASQQYSFYNYQTVNYWECMALNQDSIMNKVINILAQEPLAKGGYLVKDSLAEEERARIDKVLLKHHERELLEQCLNRSFCMGGCLVYMDFGLNDLQQPLNLKKISLARFKGFKVIEPINCYAVSVNTYNPTEKDYMEPKQWYVVGLGVCDASHFLKFQQNEPPYMLKPMCLYFGFPLTQLIKQDIANTNMVSQGIAELIGRYRYVFLKTPRENFTTNAIDNFKARLDAMALLKDNYQIDTITTEEEIIQQTTPLSGLVENESFFYQLISAKTDIPFTKLMGKSADGMNATGEGDRKNWYDRVKNIQQSIKSNKLVIDGILAGLESGEFVEFEDFIFNPLEEANEREKVEIFKNNIEIARALTELGVANDKVIEWLKKNKEMQLDDIEIDNETQGFEEFGDLKDNEEVLQDYKDPEQEQNSRGIL